MPEKHFHEPSKEAAKQKILKQIRAILDEAILPENLSSHINSIKGTINDESVRSLNECGLYPKSVDRLAMLVSDLFLLLGAYETEFVINDLIEKSINSIPKNLKNMLDISVKNIANRMKAGKSNLN